jgi:fermentation-respiration switch protein FrsA (DUF1100 family)
VNSRLNRGSMRCPVSEPSSASQQRRTTGLRHASSGTLRRNVLGRSAVRLTVSLLLVVPAGVSAPAFPNGAAEADGSRGLQACKSRPVPSTTALRALTVTAGAEVERRGHHDGRTERDRQRDCLQRRMPGILPTGSSSRARGLSYVPRLGSEPQRSLVAGRTPDAAFFRLRYIATARTLASPIAVRYQEDDSSNTCTMSARVREWIKPKGVLRRRRLTTCRLLAVGGAVAASNVVLVSAVPAHQAPAPAATHRACGVGSRRDSGVARSFAVGVRVVRFVDHSRELRVHNGRNAPRTLPTYIYYPALAATLGADLPNATPARANGPFPLVVFAHGFAVTPKVYARLLQSWARAGYVVAAPVFPLENANAPGGPNRSDLVNEPRDVSFVISRLLAESNAKTGGLAGLIAPDHIAVAGQSDGGEVALDVGYGRRDRDRRVGATMVLSGAEMSGVGGFSFERGDAPLLAVQGTADTTNEPRFTYAFFDRASRPKYLLRLLGAGHLPPYTREGPQLATVECVTSMFLNAYLQAKPGARQRMAEVGNVPHVATLIAEA